MLIHSSLEELSNETGPIEAALLSSLLNCSCQVLGNANSKNFALLASHQRLLCHA